MKISYKRTAMPQTLQVSKQKAQLSNECELLALSPNDSKYINTRTLHVNVPRNHSEHVGNTLLLKTLDEKVKEYGSIKLALRLKLYPSWLTMIVL